ncbi:hypothetical protein ACFLQN_02240 [Candidatus Aenigmatarchaeota archaeon]
MITLQTVPNFNNMNIGQVGPVSTGTPYRYVDYTNGTFLHVVEIPVRDERGTVGIYSQFRRDDDSYVTETWASREKPQPVL